MTDGHDSLIAELLRASTSQYHREICFFFFFFAVPWSVNTHLHCVRLNALGRHHYNNIIYAMYTTAAAAAAVIQIIGDAMTLLFRRSQSLRTICNRYSRKWTLNCLKHHRVRVAHDIRIINEHTLMYDGVKFALCKTSVRARKGKYTYTILIIIPQLVSTLHTYWTTRETTRIHPVHVL